jgi:hypothetical protein
MAQSPRQIPGCTHLQCRHSGHHTNRKGLVSDHGEKKKAFIVLQKFYRELQTAQPPN